MIRFENVSFSYDNETPALDGITIDIAEGSYVCILGGNGSGKSTFAKHVNALLLPDEGDVHTAGFHTADPRSVYCVRQAAGMVFQNPDDQLVASLVEDDVAFGPENLGVETAELAKRVRQALREVGLVGFEKHETNALSGGQKQRVAIAGVLAMEPRVLILDEASAMLDPRGRAGLARVCRSLHERGLTIVVITHFMEEAADADRVVVLESGHIALDGTPADVLSRTDELARLNLDVPLAASCSRALAAAGAPVAPCIDEDALVECIVERYHATSADEATPVAAPAGASVSAAADDAAANEATAPPSPASDSQRGGEQPLVELRQVSFTYDAARAKKQRKRARTQANERTERPAWGNDPDDAWALHKVSFVVNRGEFFGIAGHTGSGKSTLVQHLNGILRPTTGSVLVAGCDTARKGGAAEVRSRVGMVFQYPEHQLFADTVYHDVAFGPRNLGLADAEVDERVHRALKRVGLADLDTGKSPFELSGGQQRRVAFAGVLAMEPEMLVLDEPAAGLDPAARASFLQLIAALHESGLTVIMVSHNMDDLAAFCDRIAVLNAGALFALGTPQEVFLRAEELRGIGLGVPSAQQLANRLRAAGLPLSATALYTERTVTRDIARILRAGEPQTAPAADR